jgi:hypothetical protein
VPFRTVKLHRGITTVEIAVLRFPIGQNIHAFIRGFNFLPKGSLRVILPALIAKSGAWTFGQDYRQ